MKVKDLIALLSKLDQDLECIGYSEELDLRTNNQLFRFLKLKASA